jgi:GTP-binding protein HflX
LFDRPKTGERAVLVLGGGNDELPVLEELQELARSAGADPVGHLISKREHADPKFFIGKGKVEELGFLIESLGAELVLFNNPLSPSQERNLEKALEVRVLDRTGLILDIFAQRAQSYEGKLQVELAQLKHLSTRLVRGWTHLERQKGGIGLRGPGETQLETDKRLIGRRILQIQKRLERVDRQRDQGRRARRRTEVPVVGLVGYTNAGKSTLFNALVKARAYAADQLFATLDTTTRQLYLGDNQGGGRSVSISDTVGFIRDLPHGLIDAFQATLQEAADASLLLHVVDASNDNYLEQMDEVHKVLAEIGADKVPQVLVFNKLDAMSEDKKPLQMQDTFSIDGVDTPRFFVSAQTGQGISALRAYLSQNLATTATFA